MGWIDEQGASLVFQGPAVVVDGKAEWQDLEGYGGRVMSEKVEFTIRVENDAVDERHRDLVVSGRKNGDDSYKIALQPPHQSKMLCRLCTSPDHGDGSPHWHWWENAVESRDTEVEQPAEGCASPPSRYDLLEHFCVRLNINTTIEVPLE